MIAGYAELKPNKYHLLNINNATQEKFVYF